MTRNRFNQAKRSNGRWQHQSTNLTTKRTHQLFLEDSDKIDMKDIYRITNVHLPSDEKDVFLLKSFVTITY